MAYNGSTSNGQTAPTPSSVLPSFSTTSTMFTLSAAPSIEIMNPTLVKQYKPQTRRKKGQFVVDASALTAGINIPTNVKITDAYIYLTSEFGENQFYLYYLTINQRANIKAASNILANMLRNYPSPINTQWGSAYQIKTDVTGMAYQRLTGFPTSAAQKVLIKYKHYQKEADKDTDSDSSSDSN
jgi:hypothetical protein